jgi:hypothetical protein
MSHKRVLYLVLLLLTFAVVPAAHAQTELPPIDMNEVLRRLGPGQGQQLLWDIMLYAIFFMALITSFLVPDKQLLATLAITAVMAMAVIAKLQYVNIPVNKTPDNLIILAVNAGMFTFPLIVAGMVRARCGTPKAMAPAVLTGLLGGGYFFLYWALVLRF